MRYGGISESEVNDLMGAAVYCRDYLSHALQQASEGERAKAEDATRAVLAALDDLAAYLETAEDVPVPKSLAELRAIADSLNLGRRSR